MKKLLLLFAISLILSACEKEIIEKQPEQPQVEQKIYHNVQASFNNKTWESYVLEEKASLTFKNTYKGVFYIWAKDENYSIKDTFKYYGSPKILYYSNGVLKFKE